MLALADRFWSKVRKSEQCWEWTGFLNPQGYGQFSVGSKTDGSNRMEGAHRVSFRLNVGPVPDGLWVLHRCDNPPCVRPDHLWLGTSADNVADKMRKGRYREGQSCKTHCKYGHPYDQSNTYYRPNGSRVCRTCSAERRRTATTQCVVCGSEFEVVAAVLGQGYGKTCSKPCANRLRSQTMQATSARTKGFVAKGQPG